MLSGLQSDMQCPHFSLGVLQGDWGTQFGMLIQFLAEQGSGGLTDPAIADLELPQLQVGLLFRTGRTGHVH